jgi:hypothetical protein
LNPITCQGGYIHAYDVQGVLYSDNRGREYGAGFVCLNKLS